MCVWYADDEWECGKRCFSSRTCSPCSSSLWVKEVGQWESWGGKEEAHSVRWEVPERKACTVEETERSMTKR